MAKRKTRGSFASTGAPNAPTFYGFLARLTAYLFAISLLFSVAGLHAHLMPLQALLAWLATSGANLLGAGARLRGSVIQLSHIALDINHECTGIFVLLVYAAFVLAYPAPWKKRVAGIAVGAAVLCTVNIGRLIALTVIASARPGWFAYLHEYFFQGIFIAMLGLLASVWTEQVRRAALDRVHS